MFDLPVQGTFYLVKNLWNRFNRMVRNSIGLDDPPQASSGKMQVHGEK